MKKLILSIILLLMASGQALADIDPITDDLSGAWRFECDEPFGPHLKKIELLATKTSIKATHFDNPAFVYSFLFQKPNRSEDEEFDEFPFFAFTIGIYKGKKRISLYHTEWDALTGDAELDAESTLINGIEENTIIFGSVCRMTRMSGYGPAGN